MAVNRLTQYDMESMIRSAAMAPLSPDNVRRVLMEHQELLREREALEELLGRLLPAWGECRQLLNELAKVAGPKA
jgi:predicted component of type VI protein secretion system